MGFTGIMLKVLNVCQELVTLPNTSNIGRDITLLKAKCLNQLLRKRYFVQYKVQFKRWIHFGKNTFHQSTNVFICLLSVVILKLLNGNYKTFLS